MLNLGLIQTDLKLKPKTDFQSEELDIEIQDKWYKQHFNFITNNIRELKEEVKKIRMVHRSTPESDHVINTASQPLLNQYSSTKLIRTSAPI
jgi:uncharacterized membrane protein YgaE (UPF0421/DUF939 family)